MAYQVTYSNPEGTAPAQGRYSHVGTTRNGNLHFLAGQLSVGADGSVVGRHDFEAQFLQVFQNLGDVLKGLGCDFNDVVRFTTYLVHSQDLEHFHRLRAEHFPNWFKGPDFPPNTLLIIDRLVKEDFLFEVEAIVEAHG